MVAESLVPLKHLRSRLLKPHNSRQQVGGLDTGSIGDKATVVIAFISPAAEHLAEKLEPSGRSGGRSPYSESYYAGWIWCSGTSVKARQLLSILLKNSS